MLKVYKNLFKYVPEKKYLAYVSFLLTSIYSVLLVYSYYYIYRFLKELFVNSSVENAKSYAIKVVALMCIGLVIYLSAVLITHLLAFRLETNLRKKGIDGLENSSFAFFDENRSGKVRKLIDDNAAETHVIVAHLIPDNTAAVVLPIVLFAVSLMIDWRICVLLVFLTILAAVLMYMMMGNKEFMKQYMEILDEMNAEAVEYVRGMQVVKIFRTTVTSYKSFYKVIVDYADMALNYSKSCKNSYIFYQWLYIGVISVAIPLIALFFKLGPDKMEVLCKVVITFCFIGILFNIFTKIMYVGMYQFMATKVVEKLENIFNEMQKDVLEFGEVEEIQATDIEFKDVSFGYEEAKVLDKLSFKIDGGKVIALVGSSGSGKTTIARLISGFYNVDSGEVKIGGRNIKEYKKDTVMKNIAFVFQHNKLFKTTIFENVKMGNPSATDKQVMQALKDARCTDILEKFEDGAQTVIGSKGVHLSGGEIQRIAIARAILKNAKIIILDEASASSDPENEYEIQRAFKNLIRGKTVIMIAHRLSSIRGVDEILVVEGGKIVERGEDAELMKANGRYASLQNMYAQANDWRLL